VCTSSTRPASPYEGQVIYETDTDKTLVWNGSAWVYLSTSTANPVGLEFIKATALSGSTTQITSCFSSTYLVYRVMIDAVQSNGTDPFTLQLLSGTTPATTTYAKQRLYVQGTTVGGTAVSAQSSIIIGYSDSSKIQSLMLEVFSPNVAAFTRFWTQQVYSDNATNGMIEMGSSVHATSTAYDGFAISCGANTFSNGTVRVYGYRN
jgi:hypothetical protein